MAPRPTPEQLDRAKKGIKARNAAVAALIKLHQAEYDDLHTKQRVALGLPLSGSGPTKEQLEERIERRERELRIWKEQLRRASGESPADSEAA